LTADACHELSVCDARRDEDRVVALDEFVGLVGVVHLESGVDSALTLLVVARPETALDVSAERLDRAGGDDALGAATDADAHVGTSAVTRGIDTACDVTIAHQAGAGTRLTDLIDELLVTRAVQNRHDDLFDRFVQCLREQTDVLADRQVDVDDADTGGTGDELVQSEEHTSELQSRENLV